MGVISGEIKQSRKFVFEWDLVQYIRLTYVRLKLLRVASSSIGEMNAILSIHKEYNVSNNAQFAL